MPKSKAGAIILVITVAVFVTLQAKRQAERTLGLPTIIPQPAEIEHQHGTFELGPQCGIFCETQTFAATLLVERLRTVTGYAVPLSPVSSNEQGRGTILLTTRGMDPALGSEGYELVVAPDHICIAANGPAGLLYGSESLLELLPPQVFGQHTAGSRAWSVPCVRIRDQPRLTWRGFMLDVSRHFFSTAEIKKLLDEMALHKLNIFHWHLTDDQGWRLEIKKYPELTKVGAWRKRIGFNLDAKSSTAYDAQGRYGGFYSQADIREIVAYAHARNITIVPEIDVPGHSSAALAAYPQFSCSGGPYTTDMSEAVSAGVFCPGNDETFKFLDDVLAEVMELFPGPFVHIGGDEVPKQNWRKCPRCQTRIRQEGLKDEHELQHYFFHRLEQFIDAHGKRAVGWSEIGSGTLAQGTVLMDWIGGGVEAARTGHDVVMSPEEFCYLDFYQSQDRNAEPPAAGAYLPLEKVYSFEPVPAQLDSAHQKLILGAQANLWTEYIPSMSRVEYMTFPRLCALAEVVWSPKHSRNWDDFSRRLEVQKARLDQLGIQYRH
ncbi:MAG TPA: beta-N-acetylhexosaminidase [Verrucomicrobiae bacterium]|nr:beta-N-acetylhexosaminidase [Verrucomicrobiae bacterium]